MRPFGNYLYEKKGGGSKPGKLEIVKTPLDVAVAYAHKEMEKYGRSLYEEMPNHDENYKKAQYRAMLGHTKRKDMPVVQEKDLKVLQKLLQKGSIDLADPYSDMTDPNNPFPEGLKGSSANNFFKNGLVIHDGNKPDDIVKVTKAKVSVIKLAPIQQQMYYSKSIGPLSKFGAALSRKFHQSTVFLTSSDFRIIDGHHRYISALLVDPTIKVNVMMVDLPISKLLPLAVAFGDARGNKRNM